ncbi:hypothetical protein CH306_01245 [Rhodococcus sp. 15-725-2-2b]|uniref:HNH endonuclease n=1 Tax=Rhodococcus sp. 15-725-2-2b TaxID=2023139 RepID=UPI000B9B4A29|nr:HNH endonuclease [Rhodococcus sp. 15-725-2-2b]OZE78755.1 hypothetical protein CH306_01245 [Rhodococcus sp. 15-725-2-2b]
MGALPAVSLEALTAAARAENRQAARKITACYEVHRSWITLDAEHKHYSRYGRTEMAVALGCSATVAESYISVGVALHTRLPLLRKTFETGEIDLPRVRTVCRILDNLSDDIVTSVEAEVVEAAHRLSPGPLEKEIWDILLRVAPEEAAALREFAKRFRTVTYTPAGELARIRAELTAPEAAAAWQLLEEMADTLCPKDPRGKKERLCDAFMARMHGEPRLACLCRRDDCPKADAALPDRRVPLTMVTVDIATLIGLLANPAYLAGHGSIDPDLARELARSSQWQILLTDAVTLAEKLGLAVQNPATGEWERTPKEQTQEQDPGSEATADTDADSGTNTASGRRATETHSRTDSNPEPEIDAESEPETETESEPESETETCTTTGASVDVVTDATTAPEADPSDGSAARGEPDIESTTPAAPVSAAQSASDPGPDSGSGSDAAQAPGPMLSPESGTAPDRTETGSAPERPGTVPPTSVSPPTTGPTPGTVIPPEPGAATSPISKHDQTENHQTEDSAGDTSAHSAADPAPSETDTETGAGADRQRRTQSLASAAALFCTHTPVGRGTRHSSALGLPASDLGSTLRPNRTIHRAGRTPGGLYLGTASLAAALEAAIAADPTLGKSVPRDPLTDRALIYRPDALTTAAVRFRDKHCRFPGCHRPAARCQLDHVNPFDHSNPVGGGWTTVNNLQCLCEYHHCVKTAGYWKAVMLPGGAILWTSTSKTTRITLPANGTAVPILGNDLRPHIPTQPRNSGIIAYPDPPDNHESITEPTAEDTGEPPF